MVLDGGDVKSSKDRVLARETLADSEKDKFLIVRGTTCPPRAFGPGIYLPCKKRTEGGRRWAP